MATGSGVLSAVTGVVVAFRHIAWIAGLAVLVSGVVGLVAYGAQFKGQMGSAPSRPR